MEKHLIITRGKTKHEICKILNLTTDYEGHLIFGGYRNTEQGQQTKTKKKSSFCDRRVFRKNWEKQGESKKREKQTPQ